MDDHMQMMDGLAAQLSKMNTALVLPAQQIRGAGTPLNASQARGPSPYVAVLPSSWGYIFQPTVRMTVPSC